LKAERRIISKRCVFQYIPIEIFRASFKFFMGGHIKEEKGGGVKGIKRFSVHFTVQTPLQIVFLNSFENCRSPSKTKPCTMTSPEISKKY
jgi:hypothetical protein